MTVIRRFSVSGSVSGSFRGFLGSGSYSAAASASVAYPWSLVAIRSQDTTCVASGPTVVIPVTAGITSCFAMYRQTSCQIPAVPRYISISSGVSFSPSTTLIFSGVSVCNYLKPASSAARSTGNPSTPVPIMLANARPRPCMSAACNRVKLSLTSVSNFSDNSAATISATPDMQPCRNCRNPSRRLVPSDRESNNTGGIPQAPNTASAASDLRLTSVSGGSLPILCTRQFAVPGPTPASFHARCMPGTRAVRPRSVFMSPFNASRSSGDDPSRGAGTT